MKISIVALMAACALGATAQNEIQLANTIKVEPGDSHELIVEKAVHVVPSERQMNAMKNEFIAFVHFGPNTFTRSEWGNGMEDPKTFAPSGLDTDQWVRSMKEAGMKMVILTVKHHDGFVLWQSRYTDHGIMSSDFMDGKADVLRDLSKSCQKYGLKLGIYLSPADLYQIESPTGLYGNLSEKTLRTIPRAVEGRPFERTDTFQFVVDDYNEYFLNQLFELLTEYGPISEVWFDGAHPKRKGGQIYNYPAWKRLIRTLAPEAVIFGREDIRWCGNEAGRTRDAEWNVVTYPGDPDTMTVFHDMTNLDLGSRDMLLEGRYLHYQPAETDVSIRNGWFYRDDDKQRTRSADDVFDMFERATGGNSILLLNIPPNREGRFAQRDSLTLAEVGRRIADTYSVNLLPAGAVAAELTDNDNATAVDIDDTFVVSFPQPLTFNRIVLQEPVATGGERIEEHAVDAWVDGGWKQIANAANVGYKRILRFPDVTTDSIRLRITSKRAQAKLATLGLYKYKAHAPELEASRAVNGEVTISPKRGGFGDNAAANLSEGVVIHYTTDGSTPTAMSEIYTAPFTVDNATVKAIAMLNGSESPVMEHQFGYIVDGWEASAVNTVEKSDAAAAIDENSTTFWAATMPGASLIVDTKSIRPIAGFIYTPQTAQNGRGMIEQGKVYVSNDGNKWTEVSTFELGNLINDPTPRQVYFAKPAKGRYVKIEPTRIAGDSNEAAIAEISLF